MQKTVTSKVDSHHTNPNYQCLVINLLRDPTFHITVEWDKRRVLKADWMPKEDDVLDIIEDLLRVSPTFGSKLLSLAVSIPAPISTTKKKKIEKLEDVLV